jgi:putative heme-binding domain-containing protein
MILCGSLATMARAQSTALKYGDGQANGKQSLGGSGEMIEFALPRESVRVGGLRIHGSRYGMPQTPDESFLISDVRPFQPDADRFEIDLGQGLNRLFVEVASSAHPAEWQVRFRRKSSTIEHERLVQMALTRAGDPEAGRKLFDDVEKTLCLKCHRMGDRGERIGPELLGIGGRFSRITIIESILEPSRSIAPSFDSVVVALKDGRVLNGIRMAETETVLTLADQDGRKHAIPIVEIESVRGQPLSLMPDGLEKRVTPEEFVDLIAYLASQK